MQELAARLSEAALRDETECALLQLLGSRKLQAEVVEVLFIFWMAAQAYGYSPTLKIAESIPTPSVLSDLLLESFGMFAEGDEELEEVPEDFEIPQDFDGVHGSDMPRMFRTSMSELESRTGFPFVRQMAFEWTANRSAYPEAPFQGDPWYFSRSLGEGFIGQLSSRTALRGISAYLRTLAVAEEFWGMPTDLAEAKALLALPIHPSLALLRPQRPAWFPAVTDFDGEKEATESSVRGLVAHVKKLRPDDELIAFSSPIFVSMERCVEVSLVRWSQAEGSSIADNDLAAYLEDFWANGRMLRSASSEPLSTTTIFAPPQLEGLMEEQCRAWPLAAALGFDRLGYLQHDLYPGRLFLPTLPGTDQAKLTPCDGRLEVRVNEQVIADLCYWNAGWGAARPFQFSGNCGTALISRGADYREGAASTEGTVRSFYLWQVKTLYRSNTHERFNQMLTTGALLV